MQSQAKSLKFNEELKTKLAYDWKTVFRAIVQFDSEQKGTISTADFNRIIHQHKIYLSKEELRKIEGQFKTDSSNSMAKELDYGRMS
jgi:Ca2+-binding EF-hand superfamily protein